LEKSKFSKNLKIVKTLATARNWHVILGFGEKSSRQSYPCVVVFWQKNARFRAVAKRFHNF
jgi:hypothetical protein